MTRAYLLISAELGREREVRERLEAHPEVKEVYTVLGKYDIIAKIKSTDSGALKDVVFDKIRPIDGVHSTLTMIITDPEV